MSFNTFGKLFRFTTWGESHGPAIGCIVDGCPPNISLNVKDIQTELEKDKQSKESTVSEIQNTVPSDVVNTVIEVVVKHTGYPADFVELDQDLESHNVRQ